MLHHRHCIHWLTLSRIENPGTYPILSEHTGPGYNPETAQQVVEVQDFDIEHLYANTTP